MPAPAQLLKYAVIGVGLLLVVLLLLSGNGADANAVGLLLIGWLGRSKLQEIHVLVNSRLQLALKELADLKTGQK